MLSNVLEKFVPFLYNEDVDLDNPQGDIMIEFCAEKWPSGRRRLTRNQLSGLPFREFESHLLRHFYFRRNLTKSKTPLASGVLSFLPSDDIHQPG